MRAADRVAALVEDTTMDDQKKILALVRAMADAIKDAGEIPAGTLYAALMTHGCTMEQYNGLESILLRAGLVTKAGDLLRWNVKP